jgi:hypothetical protein
MTEAAKPTRRTIDDFIPRYLVREVHETLVDAPADIALEAAEELDLLSIPLVRAIFWLRARAMGAPPPGPDDLKGLVEQTRAMGWGELSRAPGRQIVMGAAVQPWLAEPVFSPIPPDSFAAWAEPEHVKIVWTLEAEPLGPARARIRTETRVQATDDAARRKFLHYWRFARFGIVAIRVLCLPAMRRAAERRFAAKTLERAGSHPLLDHALPNFSETIVRQAVVHAPPETTFAAIQRANLMDPLVRVLFALREMPSRISARIRSKPLPALTHRVTFADLLGPESGMAVVGIDPGHEIVVGSIGRFWEKDYGHRRFTPEQFTTFDEPGYAKLAMDFTVLPVGNDESLLRYEARTHPTDDEGRRRFHRYWRIIRPGVGVVMSRALSRIRAEAERGVVPASADVLSAGDASR